MMTCLQALAILSRNHSAQLMSSIGDAIKAQAAHVRMMNKKKNISDYDELMASHCQVRRDGHVSFNWRTNDAFVLLARLATTLRRTWGWTWTPTPPPCPTDPGRSGNR